jgi:hypothetical protein
MTRLYYWLSVRLTHWAKMFLVVEVIQFCLGVLGLMYVLEHTASAFGYSAEFRSPIAFHESTKPMRMAGR